MAETTSGSGPDSADVWVIGPNQRDSNTSQTPGGLHRFEAVSNKATGSQRLWMGYAVLDPGGMTGVHHHGESETAIYILSGVHPVVGRRPSGRGAGGRRGGLRLQPVRHRALGAELRLHRGMQSRTRCLLFDWARSLDDRTEYVLLDGFRDAKAGAAHVNSEHFRTAQRDLPPHIAETPRIISQAKPAEKQPTSRGPWCSE